MPQGAGERALISLAYSKIIGLPASPVFTCSSDLCFFAGGFRGSTSRRRSSQCQIQYYRFTGTPLPPGPGRAMIGLPRQLYHCPCIFSGKIPANSANVINVVAPIVVKCYILIPESCRSRWAPVRPFSTCSWNFQPRLSRAKVECWFPSPTFNVTSTGQ